MTSEPALLGMLQYAFILSLPYGFVVLKDVQAFWLEYEYPETPIIT